MQSSVGVYLEPDQQVFVVVDGFSDLDEGNFTLTISDLGGPTSFVVDFMGLGANVVATPGQALTASVDYLASNGVSCPTCVHQVLFGLDETPISCEFSDLLFSTPTMFSQVVEFAAPLVPGVYSFYFNHHLEFNCQDALNNYNLDRGLPIGTVTVMP